MLANLVCPISTVRIDRNVVRTNGLITTLLLVAYVFTRQPWIIVPIGLDYVLRARMSGPTSPMAHFARLVAKTLRLPARPMDKAPKVFASRIGVCFAMGGAIAHFVAPQLAPWIAGTLAVFTALESIADLCVGCVVYTYVALPLNRARQAVLSIPLFNRLDESMLVSIAEKFEQVSFPEGEQILAEGTPGNDMFVIKSGQVEVYRDQPGGGRNVISTHKDGDWFGEMALLTGAARSASVRAISFVSALRLQRSELENLFQEYPGMRPILERTVQERLAADKSA